MPRFWQIAYPHQIKSHDHMPGPKRFLEGLINHIHAQGDVAIVFPQVELPWTRRGITLNFHTSGYAPNTYHYKESFLKDWVQIDRLGYTGFHSWTIARDAMPMSALRQQIIARKLNNYSAARVSKYDQASDEPAIGGRYVFFPLQKPQDETTLFARFEPEHIVAALRPWCEKNDVKLVLKRHPFCHSTRIANWLGNLKAASHVVITQGNVRRLIDNADAVLTINSSVGFEALLLDKPVFTFGKSEYSTMTDEVFDLRHLPDLLDQKIGQPCTQRQAVEDFSVACLFDSHDAEDIAAFYETLAAEFDRSFLTSDLPPPLPAQLDLSEHGNAGPHILHGFSYAEEWGRWTNDHQSSLIFYQRHGGENYNALIDLYAYVKDSYPVQLFDVVWNGETLLRNQVCHNEHPRLPVGLKLTTQPGLNVLSLVPRSSVHPADLPNADFDVRKLGLRITKITFEKLPSRHRSC